MKIYKHKVLCIHFCAFIYASLLNSHFVLSIYYGLSSSSNALRRDIA